VSADAVRATVAAGASFDFKDHEHWQDHNYRAAFSKAQKGKCGFCEVHSRNHPGAIEHFAPKGSVHELEAPGRELIDLCNVEGRKTVEVCSTGYWWLAYSWDNWLFACERCNTGWKRCLFPIVEKRSSVPTETATETWLLLSPYDDSVDPVNHLEFTTLGEITPRAGSVRGRATIETCGLDRESLRSQRFLVGEFAFGFVGRLTDALASKNWVSANDAAGDLLKLGSEDRAHAGMVRSVVLTELKQSWSDLQELKRRLEEKLAATVQATRQAPP
jgi:hypothetical protein